MNSLLDLKSLVLDFVYWSNNNVTAITYIPIPNNYDYVYCEATAIGKSISLIPFVGQNIFSGRHIGHNKHIT